MSRRQAVVAVATAAVTTAACLSAVFGASAISASSSKRSASPSATRARARASVSATAVPAQRISFGDTTCAPSWRAPQPGENRFIVANDSDRSATVYLFRADSGAIVATINALKPGGARDLAVSLKPQRSYAWGCDLDGYPRHVSEAQATPLQRAVGDSGLYVVPVSAGELVGPLRSYRRYVSQRIIVLVRDVAGLRATIAAGDLGDARKAWLTARLAWLSIGQDDGAYGAFGDLGSEIDGTSDGLIGGVNNPRFTGFHRVEHDLWGRGGPAVARRDSAELAGLVARLARTHLSQALSTSVPGLVNWTLRGHEVLEDALRDTLSGDDDYGSHTALAALGADIAATRKILSLQAALITPRAPYLLGTARRELRTLASAMKAADRHGRQIAVDALSSIGRERIDAAAGAALQTLSRVPDLLRIGTT